MTDTHLLECRQCVRLAGFLAQVRKAHPDYHARPVLPFGVAAPKLLIVGLAPGMHGANRTGRPFTGDTAGILLYKTLHKYGLANQPEGVDPNDGLKLKHCRITNAVKCLPPENKPLPVEIKQCNGYLRTEIAALSKSATIFALGNVAHQAVLRAVDLKIRNFPFQHGACHKLPGGRVLFDSYHCSRYNTSTRRLTPEMFDAVVAAIAQHIK
ncbi:MAG: uracil-DNA glycosylase [Burkholderiales bacterium]